MYFEIEKNVFEYFPNMRVVTVLAKGFDGTVHEEKINEYLDDGWKTAAACSTEFGNPQSHPNIKPWGERMKNIGVSRKKYPSSVEALVRRAGKNENPVRINLIVDFYNAISLKYLVPAGAYDIEQLNDNIKLRFSKEGDTFQALDSDEVIDIPEGEISYADGSIIITRHFIWKQSKHMLLTPQSKDILFVSEILGELPENTAFDVGQGISRGLRECFEIDSKVKILDVNDNKVEL